MFTTGDNEGLDVGNFVGVREIEGKCVGAGEMDGLADGLGPGPVGASVGAEL